MTTVFSKAPLRMALAGGGTDLHAYYSKYGGAVLNVTIEKYAYCKVEPYRTFCFSSIDLVKQEAYDPQSFHRDYVSTDLKLLINTYQYFTKDLEYRFPVKITTYVEAPPGSGLGSSSALVVALVAAITEYYGIPMGEYDIADAAVEIERSICKLPGGKQDQFAAAFGGFNFIEFLKDGKTIVNPLRLSSRIKNMMELNTILFYVGSRKDTRVIETTSKNLNSFWDKKVVNATHKIKDACIEYKKSLLKGDYDNIAKLMIAYWESKLETNPDVATLEIKQTYRWIRYWGAKAAKISGAGGGGHMVLFTTYEDRQKLINNLPPEGAMMRGPEMLLPKDSPERIAVLQLPPGGKIVPFKFVDNGVEVWQQ